MLACGEGITLAFKHAFHTFTLDSGFKGVKNAACIQALTLHDNPSLQPCQLLTMACEHADCLGPHLGIHPLHGAD